MGGNQAFTALVLIRIIFFDKATLHTEELCFLWLYTLMFTAKRLLLPPMKLCRRKTCVYQATVAAAVYIL